MLPVAQGRSETSRHRLSSRARGGIVIFGCGVVLAGMFAIGWASRPVSAGVLLSSNVGEVEGEREEESAPQPPPQWFRTDKGTCSILSSNTTHLTVKYTSQNSLLFTMPPYTRVLNAPILDDLLNNSMESRRNVLIESNFAFGGKVDSFDNGFYTIVGSEITEFADPQLMNPDACACQPIFQGETFQWSDRPEDRGFSPQVGAEYVDRYIEQVNNNLVCAAHDVGLAHPCMTNETIRNNTWCLAPFCYVKKSCPGSSEGGFFPNYDLHYIFCGQDLVINDWTIDFPPQCSVYTTPAQDLHAVARGTCNVQDGVIHSRFDQHGYSVTPTLFTSIDDQFVETQSVQSPNASDDVMNTVLEQFQGKFASLHNPDGDETVVRILHLNRTDMIADVVYSDRLDVWNTPYGAAVELSEVCTVFIDPMDATLAILALSTTQLQPDDPQRELIFDALLTMFTISPPPPKPPPLPPLSPSFWTETVIVSLSIVGGVVFLGLLVVALSFVLTPERASSLGTVFQALSGLLSRSSKNYEPKMVVVRSEPTVESDVAVVPERKASASLQTQEGKVPTLRETLESTQQSVRSARDTVLSAGRGALNTRRFVTES